MDHIYIIIKFYRDWSFIGHSLQYGHPTHYPLSIIQEDPTRGVGAGDGFYWMIGDRLTVPVFTLISNNQSYVLRMRATHL